MSGGDSPLPEPATRVVVLGASNVQLGLPAIVRACREAAGGPVDLFAALGHGRSYGRPSSIPGRTLPAITECRLWDDLAARPPAPTFSLVTDVGNDLLYGRTPEWTLDWVADCADRLARHGPVALTGLPTANLDGLGEWRYRAFRTLFFPAFRRSLAELADLAHGLHDRLEALAAARAWRFVELDRAWYGFDPIHFRWRSRGPVWRKLIAESLAAAPADRTDAWASTPAAWSRLWGAPPAERTLFGRRRTSEQPAVTLGDGTRVSLY